MQTTISNIPGPLSLDHSQWPQQLQARNEETKKTTKKTFSLCPSLSLKLFYLWIATEWELAKAFNSSTALRNRYTVCIEFGEHTEEAEIKTVLSSTPILDSSQNLFIQGTDQLLWFKTKLLYNETRGKERREKKYLVFCEDEWKINC